MRVEIKMRDGSLVSFSYEGQDYSVEDITECWIVGNEVAFRVAADGQTFDLRGDPATLAWTADRVETETPPSRM